MTPEEIAAALAQREAEALALQKKLEQARRSERARQAAGKSAARASLLEAAGLNPDGSRKTGN